MVAGIILISTTILTVIIILMIFLFGKLAKSLNEVNFQRNLDHCQFPIHSVGIAYGLQVGVRVPEVPAN